MADKISVALWAASYNFCGCETCEILRGVLSAVANSCRLICDGCFADDPYKDGMHENFEECDASDLRGRFGLIGPGLTEVYEPPTESEETASERSEEK